MSPEDGSGAATALSGPSRAASDCHNGCRVSEFARWNRIMLEHEREYLSNVMANSGSFMMQWERELIVHDLTDIDYLLQRLPARIEVPK